MLYLWWEGEALGGWKGGGGWGGTGACAGYPCMLRCWPPPPYPGMPDISGIMES